MTSDFNSPDSTNNLFVMRKLLMEAFAFANCGNINDLLVINILPPTSVTTNRQDNLNIFDFIFSNKTTAVKYGTKWFIVEPSLDSQNSNLRIPRFIKTVKSRNLVMISHQPTSLIDGGFGLISTTSNPNMKFECEVLYHETKD